MYRPPLPPWKYSWYLFLYCGRKDYVNEKNPVTTPGIEHATFRLVAQWLNQLRHQQRAPNEKYRQEEM
jgi:hypothetical protein